MAEISLLGDVVCWHGLPDLSGRLSQAGSKGSVPSAAPLQILLIKHIPLFYCIS